MICERDHREERRVRESLLDKYKRGDKSLWLIHNHLQSHNTVYYRVLPGHNVDTYLVATVNVNHTHCLGLFVVCCLFVYLFSHILADVSFV